MLLYLHKTDGGAEYWTTKENDLKTTVIRTDGDELEIMNLEQLKRAGFKSIMINGERTEL